MQIFTETAGEMTSITTLHAKAPVMLFDVRVLSANNFLEGSAKILFNMYTKKMMKLEGSRTPKVTRLHWAQQE